MVLNNDEPNVWAMPGGKITINRGLLMLLEDEAQLAAVLSHEIVHAAARHTALQLTQEKLLDWGETAAKKATANSEYSKLVEDGSLIGSELLSAS